MRMFWIGSLALVGAAAPDALGQKIADCDWTEDLTLVTFNEPLNIPNVDFVLATGPTEVGTSSVFGNLALVLNSGETGSVDLGPATDPTKFATFADRFAGDPSLAVYLSVGLGPSFDHFFSDTTNTPALQFLFTQEERDALLGAPIQFFRINVDGLTIENNVGGDPMRSHILATGSFEIWIPTPGAAALLGMAGLPLIGRRRR